MSDISRTPYEIDKLKSTSFLFLLICGFFSLVFWWQQIVKFRILTAKWYHSFMECCLFFVGIFMLWQAVNAFKNGIDTNIGYRVGRHLSKYEKEKLYADNFFLSGYLNYSGIDQFANNYRYNYTPLYLIKDSIIADYFLEGEKLLKNYHTRIHKEGVVLDSQFFVRKGFLGEIEDNIYNFGGFNSVYNSWENWISKKSENYLKPIHAEYETWWDFETKTEKKGWRKYYPRLDTYQKLDSVYQLFTPYEKYQVDSVRANCVNFKVDELRKSQDFNLLRLFPYLLRRDIKNILDTCSNAFFNHQRETYLELLKSKSGSFEFDFKRHQVFEAFTPNDLKIYKKYLDELVLTMPIGTEKVNLDEMEVGLYYRRDSLSNEFMRHLTPRSKRIYEELMAFYINHHVKKEKAAELSGIFRWNKTTGKYNEIEKYMTKGFLDTLFFYCDSLSTVKLKRPFIYPEVLDLMNGNFIWNITREIDDWKKDKDTFLIIHEYKYIKRRAEGDYFMTKIMRRDSIPMDTVFKWCIEKQFDYLERNFRFGSKNDGYQNYKKYRNTQINDADSTFLDQVFTKCGYIKDSTEHSRLFFHANAYYLLMADMEINKSKALLKGWQPFYLSTNNKLAIIILSFLLFFTSLVQSNLFTAAFIAFFINFVNNTLFNLGQNFQELDKNKQSFWLFSLLSILALITAINVLFRQFKLPIIYLLINVQLLALLGIFVWVFDSQTIEQQRNYAYLSIAFWGLMVWKYRHYLALPSKR